MAKLLRINLGLALFLLIMNLAMWFSGIKPPGGDDLYFLCLGILLLLFVAFEMVAGGLCLVRRDYRSLLFVLATIVVIVLLPVIFFTVFPPGSGI